MCKQLLQANILRQHSLFHEGSPLVTGSTVMVWVGGVMTGLPLSRAPTHLPLDKWHGVHSFHFHSVTTRHHEQVQEASCWHFTHMPKNLYGSYFLTWGKPVVLQHESANMESHVQATSASKHVKTTQSVPWRLAPLKHGQTSFWLAATKGLLGWNLDVTTTPLLIAKVHPQDCLCPTST